jgi:uncharacterized protein YecE (DUF72 family)
MGLYVGTSGWSYGWNADGTLDWYVDNSDLNAIELNASFYRFPFPTQVRTWAKKGSKLRWSVKVNQLMTHRYKFSTNAEKTWKKFHKLFRPLDKNIDFYLFQLPPMLTPNSAEKIERFFKKTGLGKRFALEVRNEKWFAKEWLDWAKKLGLTWVSIDAPELSRQVYRTSDSVYLRMHGRSSWYSHNYSATELKEVLRKIRAAKPRKAYVFFNNNHNMLANARTMLKR